MCHHCRNESLTYELELWQIIRTTFNMFAFAFAAFLNVFIHKMSFGCVFSLNTKLYVLIVPFSSLSYVSSCRWINAGSKCINQLYYTIQSCVTFWKKSFNFNQKNKNSVKKNLSKKKKSRNDCWWYLNVQMCFHSLSSLSWSCSIHLNISWNQSFFTL